ncbi:MAG: anthranilate phosphoribosyltransferase, partial [Anaerolineae bacterium]|nr:anthranilate phosphoribosyltransferase [Anaerolineae bacterium]
IAQRVKGEAVDEINGFIDAARAEFIQFAQPNVEGLLDLAVPYDGKAKTAQLAPAIALILAAAGVPVILHGDENIPTKAGITPGAILAELGVCTNGNVAHASQMVENVGIGFIGAAQYIPAWHNLTPIRNQFGLRTVMNTVEKLFNPFNAPYQISGFFHANYIERIRTTQTGLKASWMVQGEEGSIEMAAGRRTHIYAVAAADDVVLDPADVGLVERERLSLPPVLADHVAVTTAVLQNASSAATEQTLYTVGTILSLLGKTESVAAGFAHARQLVAQGTALQKLEAARAYRD